MPFAEIVGHTRLVELLKQAVALGRVPQSLLFAGPEGVGKRAVAVALAQAVNCTGSEVFSTAKGPADPCLTCQRIARGQHADVTIIDKGGDSSIKIKALRERLLEVVGYRPFEARRRVYIIDPADELTTEAQDALLKTLEEPPASAIIILVTAYPDTLLPTIQSRCRRLRFGPLAEQDVARMLTNRGMDPARARLLAAASGGSVGRALAEEDGSLTEDREAAMALIVAAATRGTVAARLKAGTALAQHGSKRRDREAVAARLATVASLVRDLTAIDAGAPDVVVNADLIGSLHEAARGFDAGRLSSAFGAVSQAQAALDRNASPKIVADWVALTI